MLNLKNTLDGYLKNVEVIGNTIQDTNNLADIRSVGDKVEGQELYNISIQVDNGKGVSEVVEILSPVQLEKVGDVADRIVCKSGVWGVEKNVIDEILDETRPWSYAQHLDKDYSVLFTIGGFSQAILNQDESCFTDLFINKNVFEIDEEGCYISNSGNLYLRVSKEKAYNLITLKSYLTTNNIKIKYAKSNNAFIPLPHDQQVKLRTFAGQTNIAFLTEIPGQVKAQVPKSLGATVNTHTEQITELHNSLERVKKLEETTVSTIETGSGFTTVDATSNGYFEDVKLEGKTLVNKLINPSNVILSSDKISFYWNTGYIFTNKNCYDIRGISNNFTIISTTGKPVEIAWLSDDGTNVRYMGARKNVVCDYIELPTNATSIAFYVLEQDGWTLENALNANIMLLEGDHTNNPPGYYKGLMSVGQDVEEVNVKSVSGNLFDGNVSLGYLHTNGSVAPHKTWVVSDFIDIQGVSQLRFESTVFNGLQSIGLYNSDKEIVSNIFAPTTFVKVDKSVKYVRVAMCKNPETEPTQFELENPCIEMYVTNKVGKKHQSNKKPLLYYNPTTEMWEKPILREWDTIEKHSDGKYYYHKRSGEVVLSGSEDWVQQGTNGALTLRCAFVKDNCLPGLVVCDRFSKLNIVGYSNIEGIFINTDKSINLFINKSKLSTQDVEGFKAWLKDNPTTVVYQLAQEEVYECTNIDLMTYSGETNYIINSGAISPKSLLKVHNNISNVVKILQEKVSLLENTFIAGLKSVLSGDMYSLATILYPEDFEQNDNTEQDIMVIPE